MTRQFEVGDVVRVPLKDQIAEVTAVTDHDEHCIKGRDCPRSDVQMVKLRGRHDFPWGWFHANTLEQS